MIIPRSPWSAALFRSTGLATASSILEWSLSHPKQTFGICSSRFQAQDRYAGSFPAKPPRKSERGISALRFWSYPDSQAQNTPTIRSQGHTNPDFARPPLCHVGDHPLQTYGGEKHRQDAKESRETSHQPITQQKKFRPSCDTA